ncbi:NACHT domain-containing protein [Paractinoplanes deccanensis]|nr:NACHT domain-containing protein [Actinoplanes deccanensis]
MVVEAILLRIGTTVATVGGKALIAGRRSAAERRMGLVELAGARGLGLLPQRKLLRQMDQLAETIADRLQPVVDAEMAAMPSADRQLVLEGVAAALEETEFGDDVLFDANLDEAALLALVAPAAESQVRRLGLSEAGEAFFARMMREAIAHLVEVIITLPSFQQRALRELLARDSEIIDLLRQVLAQMPRRSVLSARTAEAEFEVDYRREVIRKFDRVELFGVTVAGPTRRYSLDVAYIGLLMSGRDDQAESTIDEVVSASRCVYISGLPGSGKTTLLRWLALRSALGGHHGRLAGWNRLVPVLVELRRFADQEFPGPSKILTGLSRSLIERVPDAGWVARTLSSGRGVLLLDGVDEIPKHRRAELHEWIGDLVHDYPKARIVVTSRPGTTAPEWLDKAGFAQSDLLPMTRAHVAAFLRHWHAAVKVEAGSRVTDEEAERFRRAMVASIDRSRPLRTMATNPLLCALLCALNWERRTQLPQRRIEIYRAALEMLLRRRDHERQISDRVDIGLEYDDRLAILQDLAYWFTSNGLADADEARVRAKISSIITAMPHVGVSADDVHDFLLARSGVLREPAPGRIDFVHKTFQEYLAAARFVDSDAIEALLRHAESDEFHEVIVMAAGYARQHEAERLVTALLDRADRRRMSWTRRARLRLLALSCSEVVLRMSPEVNQRVMRNLGKLVPPANLRAARVLAGLGEDVLPALPEDVAGLPEASAAATLYTAALVGGPAALRIIARFGEDRRPAVCQARQNAWGFFDAVEFAEAAFGPHPDGGWRVDVTEAEMIRGLPYVTDLGPVRCDLSGESGGALAALRDVRTVEAFALRSDDETGSLDFLAGGRRLTSVIVEACANLRDIGAILDSDTLHTLAVRNCPVRLDRESLTRLRKLGVLSAENITLDLDGLLDRLPGLRRLELATDVSGLENTRKLGGRRSALSALTLAWCPDLRRLDGLDDLPLRRLWIIDCPRLESLMTVRYCQALHSLRLKGVHFLDDIDFLDGLSSLRSLAVENSTVGDWWPLRDSDLRDLTLLGNNSLPDAETLKAMRGLKRIRVEGLGRILGPEAQDFVAELQSSGIRVIGDAQDDRWLFDDDEELADREDLAALSGREELAGIMMTMRHAGDDD